MRYLSLVILLLGLGVSISAQDTDEGDSSALPDEVMQQVVSRIAKYYFKPSLSPQTIYFSDENVRYEWLPKIRNLRFVVLKRSEIQSGTNGYTFTIEESKTNLYEIGFGYGEIGCSGGGTGVLWSLRLTNPGIRLWRVEGQRFGWACDQNAASKLKQTTSSVANFL